MSYKRVKDVDYDRDEFDDDFDDEPAEEEIVTAEDRVQLQKCGIEVRRELGDLSDRVTEKEISDALWHYYYDIQKTVAYVRGLHTTKKSKNEGSQKVKPQSKFDLALKSTATTRCTNSGSWTASAQPSKHLPPGFWDDMPWGNIPEDRRTIFTPVDVLPRGRLLGGAPKMSKLATLAAAKKKAAEEKRQASDSQDGAMGSSSAVSLLDRLVTKKDSLADDSASSQSNSLPTSKLAFRRKPAVEKEIKAVTELSVEDIAPPKPKQNLRASPSSFAEALLGTQDTSSLGGVSLQDSIEQPPAKSNQSMLSSFGLPYATNEIFTAADPFSKPSPDDVVLTVSNTTTRKKGLSETKPSLIDGIASLSIVPEKIVPEKIKSKNLNVEEEFTKANLKRTAAFVVVGHVDHGKSTLMGRLLYDLKFVNEQTMRKFKKESEEIGKASFALAWVMDSTSDERSRGITVDTATKSFETEKTKFTILDAPGHLDFIPNMIAGASQADFAVLVIDAGINGFESGLKGQTKEHALLVRSMGVQRLVVAVNKMDRVDWSEERYNKIQEQTIAFLTAANFSSSQITFVPCAGLSGDNILTPISSPDGSWYAGPTLVEALDSIETAASGSRSKPLLLVTSDVFPNPTSANSTSIAGRLEAGSVQNGDRVLLQPANEIATVKSIDVDESPVDWAVAGQIITLNLVDVDASHIRRGDVASHPDHPLKTTSQLTLKILTFEHIMPTYMDMLRGRLQVSGRISELIATLDKTTGRAVGKKNPRVLQPGVAARVVLSLDREIPIAEGWRVVLRTEGRTIAAGLVENEASS